MAQLQYIGARYVPKFYENSLDPSSSDWESGQVYEALTIVTYNSVSYISKIPVPATVSDPAANPAYWAKTTDLPAAIASLQNEVNDIKDALVDIAIDRWYADNEKKNNLVGTPANLSYRRLACYAPNFRDFLEIERWKPMRDWTKELAFRTNIATPNINNCIVTVIENGVKVQHDPQSESSGNFILRGALAPINGSFIGATVQKFGDPSTDRIGIAIGAHSYVYINNDNTIHYETNYGTSTQLNARVFNNDTDIDLLVGTKDRRVFVWAKEPNEEYEFMGSFTDTVDLRLDHAGTFGILRTTEPANAGIMIKNLRCGFTYESFADCKYIHYDDTTPYIVNNKAYLTAGLKSHGGMAITGILEHTLGFGDLKLIGVILCNDDMQGLGTDLMFDRKDKKFYATFRLQEEFNGNTVDCCAYCISNCNNLAGVNRFKATILPRVANTTDFGNYLDDEDPAICHFDGKWYIAINRKADDIHSTYYYNIYRSDSEEFDINSFSYVGSCVNNSLTGGGFLAVYDRLYFVTGDGTSISLFDATSGALLGSLPMTMSNRVWGNLTFINRGNYTKFYLTTFDRTLFGDDSHSYGCVVMYESDDSEALDDLMANNTYGTR